MGGRAHENGEVARVGVRAPICDAQQALCAGIRRQCEMGASGWRDPRRSNVQEGRGNLPDMSAGSMVVCTCFGGLRVSVYG